MDAVEYHKAIRLLALHNVVKGTPEYWEQYILRWYSKTFHTPLAVVKEMPLEEVLMTFYEDKYAEYEEDKLKEEIRDLTETPEERTERLKQESIEEANIQDLVSKAAQQNKKMADVVPESKPVFVPKEANLPEAELKKLIRPDVQMKFVDSNEFERLVESIDALNEVKRDK